MWIYEDKDWPEFKWDEKFLGMILSKMRYKQGLLIGRMIGLGFDLKQEAGLKTLTNDVVKTSAIEGEILNPAEVRSSIARKLGIEIGGLVNSGRDVDGIVEVMLDATQKSQAPLTKERLFDWHAAIFPTGRSGMHRITVANWRTVDSGSMQVVSGAIGKETIHFEAPSATHVEREIELFLKWFNKNQELDPILKAGIAHFWFVTIHPFDDGNGRIARAIGDMALARADGIVERFYSLSSQIESEKKLYYTALEKQQRNNIDITMWLTWFLDCLDRAFDSAEKNLEKVIYKSKLWELINKEPINKRQQYILNRMLDDDFKGYINTSKYAKLSKCSNDTALRDIQNLKGREIFLQNPGSGRSTSYRLPEISEI